MKYVRGNQLRQTQIKSYQIFAQETENEISDLNSVKIPHLSKSIQEMTSFVKREKIRLLEEYNDASQKIYERLRTIPGSNEQLVDIILSMCHLYGEMTMDSRTKDGNTSTSKPSLSTCIPLRLAGLDIGLLWNFNSGNDVTLKSDDETTLEIASLLIHNAKIGENNHEQIMVQKDTSKVKTESKKDKARREEEMRRRRSDSRRRKEDKDDDEDYYATNDYDHHYDDDDYYQIDDDDSYNEIGSEDNTPKKSHHDIKVQKNKPESDGIDNIDQYTFHSPIGKVLRSSFYNYAKNVLKEIDDALKNDNENDEEDKNGEESSTSSPLQIIDPMAVTMVRNSLSRRSSLIEYGNDMALSASSMLQSLEHYRDENLKDYTLYLKDLVIGTIYYSNIQDADLVEILLLTLYNNLQQQQGGENSCLAWYFSICNLDLNTEISNVHGSMATFPGEALRTALSNRCIERRDQETICSDGGSTMNTIPSNVSDGYFNFYIPQQREPNDHYSTLLQGMNDNHKIFSNSNELSKIEENASFAEDGLSELTAKVRSLEDALGDEIKYGPDGILYALRDDCYEILSNKYTYELCMFGKSLQREGSSKGKGTDLGSWDGFVEKENGLLILKWSKGQKCWNGPQRSSTVFVTCGVQTKLLSADEPNICEYEFKMESHIACDDAFKTFHGIEV